MTALAWHENVTGNEHRKTVVSWARRALRPCAAVIIGFETTAPGAGALIEMAVMETDTAIRLNTLVLHGHRSIPSPTPSPSDR